MNKVYFGNNNMGSTAVKAFLLGWPHNIYWDVHGIFRDDQFIHL